MGHVDHGKTSLLDYVRKENVIAGESGGITTHWCIRVTLDNGQKIVSLRYTTRPLLLCARGAQVTDIAIIVIAADDDIMPQTKEAISHAQAAGVPIIFAINKIDKPNSNPEKIKEKLAGMNLLVEDWGGKSNLMISLKVGTGVKELLEKFY
jgi:translation initiation factor IF-2